MDAKIKILQLQTDNIYRMIKDEEQFNKRWLERYALMGSIFNDFKEGGKTGEEKIGKVSIRNIPYNDAELKKLATQIYSMIIDSFKSDIPKKIDDQPKPDDGLEFEDFDYENFGDEDGFE